MTAPVLSDPADDVVDHWLNASGEYLISIHGDPIQYPAVTYLESQIENGNRTALMPLIWMLVRSGRIEAAEVWMEGRGWLVPVTRRDLAIALAWYGRYGVFDILSSGPDVPPDLVDDDYGPSIGAVLEVGWMSTAPDGFFYSHIFIGPEDLDRISDIFFSTTYTEWERSWISISELDLLFHSGSYGRGD